MHVVNIIIEPILFLSLSYKIFDIFTARPSTLTLASKAEVASDLASLYDRAEEGVRGWLEGWGGGQAVWKISKILSSLPSVPTGL